jgi:hypothetical protein
MPFEDGEGEVEVSGEALFGTDAEGEEAPETPEGEGAGEEKPPEVEPKDGVAEVLSLPQVRAMVEEASRTGKPLALTAEQIAKQGPEVHAFLANVALRLQQDQQASAKAQQALEEERAKVRALERQARLDKATLGKFGTHPGVAKFLEGLDAAARPPAGADPDSPEAIRATVLGEVRQTLAGFFKALEDVGAAEQEAVKQADAEAAKQARRVEFQEVINENPDDFDDEAMGVDPMTGQPAPMKLVMRGFVEKGYHLRQAHKMAVALRDSAVLAATDKDALERVRDRNTRERRQEARVPPPPSPSDTAAWLDWCDRYPDAAKKLADPATWARR